MTSTTDYDAPRRPLVALEEDSLEDLKARRTASRSPDLDEPDPAEDFDLPDTDLSDEELSVAVIPMRADEFRCSQCFLVHHRSQLAGRRRGQDICRECS